MSGKRDKVLCMACNTWMNSEEYAKHSCVNVENRLRRFVTTENPNERKCVECGTLVWLERLHSHQCREQLDTKPVGVNYVKGYSIGGNPPEPYEAPEAIESQAGGDHYKDRAIQPFHFVRRNNIPHAEGECIYKLLRWRDKGGIADLEKVIHTIQLIIEEEKTHGMGQRNRAGTEAED